jgi:uncharacterized membrane protein
MRLTPLIPTLLCGLPLVAGARPVELCNASPVPFSAAVAWYDSSAQLNARGWFTLDPGACAMVADDVAGTRLYYYAESETPLAQWLAQESAMRWQGDVPVCVERRQAFHFRRGGTCDQPMRFRSRLLQGDAPQVFVWDRRHVGATLEQAPALARDLSGVMRFEAALRHRPGREPPFQLGAAFTDTPQGPRISVISPGMPAEVEGMLAGDIVVRIDGTEVRTNADIDALLDSLPFDRRGPLALTIARDGHLLDGWVTPMWFAFNHPSYRETTEAGVFLQEFGDGLLLGFGSEVLCGGTYAVRESIRAVRSQRSPNVERMLGSSTRCARRLERHQHLHRLFHPDAAVAGTWSSLVGLGGLARATGAVRGVMGTPARARVWSSSARELRHVKP